MADSHSGSARPPTPGRPPLPPAMLTGRGQRDRDRPRRRRRTSHTPCNTRAGILAVPGP